MKLIPFKKHGLNVWSYLLAFVGQSKNLANAIYLCNSVIRYENQGGSWYILGVI